MGEERIDTVNVHPDRLGGSSPAGRLHAIDLARGLAVVAMIGAHTTDAFLADAWKEGTVWNNIAPVFGFVAPAFAFLSGVTLWPALLRRRDALATMAPAARSLILRLLVILFLGYWLQLPNLSLRQLLSHPTPEELHRLFDANILQVIAIAGLLIVALASALRSPERARIAALILGAATLAATPYIWSSDLHLHLPLPIRFYFAPQPPATFGFFPVLGYAMLGFVAAGWLMRSTRSIKESTGVLLVGAALVAFGLLIDPLLSGFPPHDQFWGSSAQHAIFRIGGVLVAIAICFLAARLMPERGNILAYLGQRSLGVYILHLMLIYGSPVTKGMRYWYLSALDGALSPLGTLAITLAILALCYTALTLWDRLRERRPALARWGVWIWWIGFAIVFLLKP